MSARRILQIIHHAASRGEPMSVSEVSEHLCLPRPTTYRLISLLEREGVLQRCTDKKRVELSNRFLSTVISGASNEQILPAFRGVLSNAADTWEATAFLGRLNAGLVKLVHAVTPSNTASPHIHPGLNVRPAHACSSARAILAFLPEHEFKDILGTKHTAFNDRTITDQVGLLEELRLTRQRGYAVCDEEIDPGVTSIAVPAVVGRAGVLCSIGVVAATRRMHESGLPAIAAFLKEQVQSTVLGLNEKLAAS